MLTYCSLYKLYALFQSHKNSKHDSSSQNVLPHARQVHCVFRTRKYCCQITAALGHKLCCLIFNDVSEHHAATLLTVLHFRIYSSTETLKEKCYRIVGTNLSKDKFIAVSCSHLTWRQLIQTYSCYQTSTHSCFSAHRFDFHNKNITVEGRLPTLNFSGDYVIRGKFVEHRIYGGTGQFNTTLRRFSLTRQVKGTSDIVVRCNI